MKIRAVILFLIVSAIYISCKTTRIAQKEKEVPGKPVTVQPPPKPVEEKPKEKPKSSAQFKIALLLPLYLEQNFQIDTSDAGEDIEQRSLPALSFYEGVMLAADSLEKTGIKVKADVFDIAPDSSAKRSILLRYRALKEYDLIFANYPSSQAVAAADEAKFLGLKMVLTQFENSTLLKNNTSLVFASPSAITQCRLMADYILDQYHYSNFIVLSRNIKRENELADVFKKQTDSLLQYKFKTENKSILINNTDSLPNTLQKYITPARRNIVFLPSSDESYVSSILNGLDTLNQQITVVGLPTWENFETIQFSRLLRLEIYVFSSTFLDYADEKVKLLRKIFIEHYKNDPLFNAFQGFYLTQYYSKLFRDHDKNFLEHTAKESGNYPFFKFIREDSTDGFENNVISVLKYRDYELLKVNR